MELLLLWFVNPLPHNDDLWPFWGKKGLMKTLWEKEKMLITSIFSFSHNVVALLETVKVRIRHHIWLSTSSSASVIEYTAMWKFCGKRRTCELWLSSYEISPLPQLLQNWLDVRSKTLSVREDNLTLTQTTNFRLFQTEIVCKWQFQIWQKCKKVIRTGRKHCGKRRNWSLRAISLFPTVFSKGLFRRGVKRCHCVGMG